MRQLTYMLIMAGFLWTDARAADLAGINVSARCAAAYGYVFGRIEHDRRIPDETIASVDESITYWAETLGALTNYHASLGPALVRGYRSQMIDGEIVGEIVWSFEVAMDIVGVCSDVRGKIEALETPTAAPEAPEAPEAAT